MTRFLLLIPFLTWLIYTADPSVGAPWTFGVIAFLGGYVILILAMGVWSRWVARHVDSQHFQSRLRRFNFTLAFTRHAVIVWYGVALFGGLRWGQYLHAHFRVLERWPVTLPIAFVATLPPYLAWMGLWWSQFPAERALREQGLLALLESDLPVHGPPRFASWFASNLRMQILFMLVPVICILLMRDVAFVVLWKAGVIARESRAEPIILLSSSALAFLFAPVLLTLILRTQTLPSSRLRSRLEVLCRKTRLRYRDILLWQTDNNMGNAAVMGLVPFVRYILLSDLLLETMTDEQVEAVFAHEVGHIVHRHMAWYVVLILILMLGMSLAQILLEPHLPPLPKHVSLDVILNVAGFGIFITIFGFLSRRFERQADVYAARTIEQNAPMVSEIAIPDLPALSRRGPAALEYETSAPRVEQVEPLELRRGSSRSTGIPAAAKRANSCVGPHGASVFASALYRVAVVNNIPVRARNFTHGSIAARMKYLERISRDPEKTSAFDRIMLAIYCAMIIALVLFSSAAWIYRDRLMS